MRPSGTEPKIKFYLFGKNSSVSSDSLAQVKADLAAGLESLWAWLQEDAKSRVARLPACAERSPRKVVPSRAIYLLLQWLSSMRTNYRLEAYATFSRDALLPRDFPDPLSYTLTFGFRTGSGVGSK